MAATDEGLVDMEQYLIKTYKKTASLMANSCKSVAILGGHPPEVERQLVEVS